MAKYIATQSVGRYLPGETVEGLSAERAKTLLVMGAIKEVEGDQEETQESLHAVLAQPLSESYVCN